MAALAESAVSARDAIKKLLLLTTADLVKDKQHKGCFIINASVELAAHDKDINDVICQNDKEIEAYFCNAIKQGQLNGEIPAAQNAQALARFIFNTVKGMRVSAKSGQADKKMFEDIIEITLSVLD
jgi:TetR/AcrR family transcriptional repressor of nem operon